MTSREITELRSLRAKLLALAERLDGQNIGVKPIRKGEAALQAWDVAARIKTLVRDE